MYCYGYQAGNTNQASFRSSEAAPCRHVQGSSRNGRLAPRPQVIHLRACLAGQLVRSQPRQPSSLWLIISLLVYPVQALRGSFLPASTSLSPCTWFPSSSPASTEATTYHWCGLISTCMCHMQAIFLLADGLAGRRERSTGRTFPLY